MHSFTKLSTPWINSFHWHGSILVNQLLYANCVISYCTLTVCYVTGIVPGVRRMGKEVLSLHQRQKEREKLLNDSSWVDKGRCLGVRTWVLGTFL